MIFDMLYVLEVARPANSADKKSLPSLIFLSFGIFLLHSVNEVIRDRQRRTGLKRNREQFQRNGRSYSEDALESLLHENGEFIESISSILSDTKTTDDTVRLLLYLCIKYLNPWVKL